MVRYSLVQDLAPTRNVAHLREVPLRYLSPGASGGLLMPAKQMNLLFQKHSNTSRDAAIAIEPAAGTLRSEVFGLLKERGANGCTDEELQDLLDMPANTERPRRRELETAGLVRDSGRTRLTRSNRKAVVWIAKTGEAA